MRVWGLRKSSSRSDIDADTKGGAENLTPEQRSAIAKKATEARWAKKRQQEES
jgi:hypothetical protein